ncbi:MAG TPA: cytochrome c oxidase subunit II [Aldersonia sp.]
MCGANGRRILGRGGFGVFLGAAAVLLSGCAAPNNVVFRFGWPEGITPQAERMRELWTWSVIAALVMGVIVWGLTFWTVYFHRKSMSKTPDEFPKQFGYNVPLELGYTAAPFVIISVLFYFTVVVQNYVDEKVPDPDVTIDVTSFQWNWKFGYRSVIEDGVVYDGRDSVREEANELLAEQAAERRNDHGEPQPGPIHGKDDTDLSYLHYDRIETVGTSYEIPVLVLPTGKRIEFILASSDVIHAFWVPEFLFKRDVNPNPIENHSENIFQITDIDQQGAFVGRCAEMCGAYHSMMNFEVRAVSPEDFARYIQARKPIDQGGLGMNNAEALASIGQSPVATSTHPFDTDRTAREASAVAEN